MRRYCINLEKREDRKELFIKNNKDTIGEVRFFPACNGDDLTYEDMKAIGFTPRLDWRDPILGRRLTKGEMGCLASHVSLWNTCIKRNEPIVVLEDDAVVTSDFDEDELYSLIDEGFNFIYLGYREMGTIKKDYGRFVVPDYGYLTHGYVVTPEACKILKQGLELYGGIPADEIIPKCYLSMNPIAYKDQVAIQLNRSDVGTDIEPTDDSDYLTFPEFKVFAVATDPSKADKLLKSAAKNKIQVEVLGKDLPSFDMTGLGGGIKVNLLRKALEDEDPNTLVMFLDGYDTFINTDAKTLQERFLGFNCDVVFSAERDCWPDTNLASEYPPSDTIFKYLNSGTFIGRAGAIKNLIQEEIQNSDDDQRYYTKKFLSGRHDIKLDTECYIFQCNYEDTQIVRRHLYNPSTGCYSCVYHGNGGPNVKPLFDRLYEECFPQKDFYISKNLKFFYPEVKDQLDRDMYVCSFLSKDMCDYLIHLGNEHNGWEPLSYDKFPAQEIRVKELGLWEDFKGVWDECVGPLYEELWFPIQHYDLRDAFLMKYTVDTQRDLPLHHDASLVTGSVKLNDNYKGARLYFPRQDVCNTDVPVGDIILFPGQVTHGHECTRLESGTKYSLTMWTNRTHNDPI